MRARLARWLRATPLHPQWLIRNERRIFAAAARGARGRVLDVGCGDRWIEQELDAGCTYHGLDSVSVGRDRYGAKPTVFADAGALPFAAGSIDTVLMFEVIEHLPDPMAATREAWRCLAPGGRLVVSVPFLYPVHDAPTDFQRYTEHGLAELLAGSGFEVASISRRLPALHTAALGASLAMGASAKFALGKPGPGSLLLPLWAVLVPLVNLGAALLGRLSPDWTGMTNGYVAVAVKAVPGGRVASEVHRVG